MQRGQAAIEFLFLILIVVVYLVTVTMPLVKDTQNSVNDVSIVAQANTQTQKLANTISEMSLLGTNSMQQMKLILQSDTNIGCEDTNVYFSIKLKQLPYPTNCPLGVCSKTIKTPQNTLLDCRFTRLIGPLNTTLSIYKTNTGVTVAIQNE